jgi:biopolymer transport protein ExbD
MGLNLGAGSPLGNTERRPLMGGSGNIGEASDNPVEINVTAMVDVIFCLCIFFMCSFHFKQLEGKVDAWLPKEKGPNATDKPIKPVLEEIRVFMRWDAERNVTVRKIGNRQPVANDEELNATIVQMKGDYEKTGKLEVPVLIDATPDVPWQEVVHVLDLCRAQKLPMIEFVEPLQYQPHTQNR